WIVGVKGGGGGEGGQIGEGEGVEIGSYAVIDGAIEELRAGMEGMVEPAEVETSLGQAEVRQLFRASRIGTIAGSYVTEGKVTRGSRVRLVRDGTVIYDTTIASLRRFNDDVREVTSGFECGIVLANYQDVREGDVLETYETRLQERELSSWGAGERSEHCGLSHTRSPRQGGAQMGACSCSVPAGAVCRVSRRVG